MTSIESNRPKVFLDTNVIIDALTFRDYDYLPSRQIWRHVLYNEIDGFICSKQITDLHYIFKKYYKDEGIVRKYLEDISKSFEVLPFLKGDILACLKTEMPDFEDAVLCEVAKVNMVPIIVTNNIDHFNNCKMMALTPKHFLEMFSLE